MNHRRTGGFTLLELLLAGAIGLLLAAIAIPAYRVSLRHSRTVEAVMDVRRLFDGAVSYYETAHFDKNGKPVPRQFPYSAGWAPNGPGVCCGEINQACPPAKYAAQFANVTWAALDFGVPEQPFYYSVQFDSSGWDTAAEFTAGASGDLNCDGKIFSLFQRTGRVVGKHAKGDSVLRKVAEVD